MYVCMYVCIYLYIYSATHTRRTHARTRPAEHTYIYIMYHVMKLEKKDLKGSRLSY